MIPRVPLQGALRSHFLGHPNAGDSWPSWGAAHCTMGEELNEETREIFAARPAALASRCNVSTSSLP